jgi:hypothetical protein
MILSEFDDNNSRIMDWVDAIYACDKTDGADKHRLVELLKSTGEKRDLLIADWIERYDHVKKPGRPPLPIYTMSDDDKVLHNVRCLVKELRDVGFSSTNAFARVAADFANDAVDTLVHVDGCLTLPLDTFFWHVIAWHTLNPADPPRVAAVDRTLFPVGERGLRQQARLHRHIVLDDDYFATDGARQSANGLRNEGSDRMAHDGNDGDLHPLAIRLLTAETGVFVMRGWRGGDAFAFPASAHGNMPYKSN